MANTKGANKGEDIKAPQSRVEKSDTVWVQAAGTGRVTIRNGLKFTLIDCYRSPSPITTSIVPKEDREQVARRESKMFKGVK